MSNQLGLDALSLSYDEDVRALRFVGLEGATGLQGPTGPQGIQGDTGPQGIQGDTGPAGVAPSSVSGTLETTDFILTIASGVITGATGTGFTPTP